MSISLIKKPSAWIPLAMSVAALAMILIHAAIFGIVREPDEGTAAHIFHVLMVAQLPLIAVFAFNWLPRLPGQSVKVLALQSGTWIAAAAAVYLLA